MKERQREARYLMGKAGLICMGLLTTQASAIPMDDAVAVWSMSDAGGPIPLQIHGKAQLGAELEGEDRKVSLALGGDGRVAELDGGYLALKDDAALQINPKQWTITIRMKDPSGLWDYPILGSYGSDILSGTAVIFVPATSRSPTLQLEVNPATTTSKLGEVIGGSDLASSSGEVELRNH